MAVFKEILRNDGSGITRFYRIDNGSITTLDYDALMNKPKINGKELIGDILIDIGDFDLSNYYTKKETNTTIQTQLANYYTKKETDNQITKRITEVSTPEVDLTDYYTKAETEALVTEKIEEAAGQDIDLTNYYTKVETETLVEEKIGEIVIPEVDLTGYYTKTETEVLIDEKIDGIEIPTTDLSNYYNKEETEAKIDEKIADIPVNDLLHFKGHVDTIDDLPKSGQVSGELIEPNYVMNTSYMDSTMDNPLTNITLKNWVATYLRSSVYAYVGSDFDDVIDGVCFGKNPYGYGFPFIHVNASSTKPATVYNCKSIWYDDGTSEDAANKLISIFKPAWVANTYSVSGAHVMYGKMDYDLKLKYWDISQATIGSDTVTNINNKSITIGDFIYNLGHKIMRFNPLTQRLSWVTTTESDIIENHVYTVGENKDLYRANEADQKWEKIGGADAYSKEEIDNMIGDINTVLTEIVEGGE